MFRASHPSGPHEFERYRRPVLDLARFALGLLHTLEAELFEDVERAGIVGQSACRDQLEMVRLVRGFDQGAEQRLDVLSDPNGVWRCRTIYNCTPACPRGIEVTRAMPGTDSSNSTFSRHTPHCLSA